MIAVGSTVRHRGEVGTVRRLLTAGGVARALVFWPDDGTEQHVDVAKLEEVAGPAVGDAAAMRAARTEAGRRWREHGTGYVFERPERDDRYRCEVGYANGKLAVIRGRGASWAEAFADADENTFHAPSAAPQLALGLEATC